SRWRHVPVTREVEDEPFAGWPRCRQGMKRSVLPARWRAACGALPSQTRWRSIQVKAGDAQIPVRFMGLLTRRRHAQVRGWLAALAAAALLTTLATGTASAARAAGAPALDLACN